MPNNASARRGKDKKNKNRKKDDQSTDTLSLPKEDAAKADSGTLSLSSAGLDKASKDIGPLVGKDDALDLSDPCYLEKAHAIRQKNKASLDGSSLSLSVVGKEQAREAARTIVSVKSDSALAMEYLQTLTDSGYPGGY